MIDLFVVLVVYWFVYFFLGGFIMFGNIFGMFFIVMIFGELYGFVIGCVIDGCLLGMGLIEVDIQVEFDCCKLGMLWYVMQWQEVDEVEILLGVFEGVMIGMLIVLLICNIDQCSKDYGNIVEMFCFGYVDYIYWQKYGICDYCGGGCLFVCLIVLIVGVGVVVKKWLCECFGVEVCGYMSGFGEIDVLFVDWLYVYENLFFLLNVVVVLEFEVYMDVLCKEGDLIGVCIDVVVLGVLVGWGELVFDWFDVDIVKVMMSINVVKGVEIGVGFDSVVQCGLVYGDELMLVGFVGNYVGGVFGGILMGQDIIVLIVIKLILSICMLCCLIMKFGEEVMVEIFGCYDLCVGICVMLIVELMFVLVLIDYVLCYCVQCGDVEMLMLKIVGSVI